jgi:hypothetical protein
MKPDLYTKTVLTVIAIMLTVIACNQYVNPTATAQAQGAFAGIVVTGQPAGWAMFDTRSGDAWVYRTTTGYDDMEVTYVGRIAAPGKAPVKKK